MAAQVGNHRCALFGFDFLALIGFEKVKSKSAVRFFFPQRASGMLCENGSSRFGHIDIDQAKNRIPRRPRFADHRKNEGGLVSPNLRFA